MTQPTSPQNDKYETPKTARRFWKKILLGLVLCLGALVFMVWVCLFREVPLEISEETTLLTEPLTPDGRVDYFRAIELELYPPNMKTDENGYRMIVRELGVPCSLDSAAAQRAREMLGADSADQNPNEAMAKEIYEKLGLDPSCRPSMSYQNPDDAVDQYVEKTFDKEDTHLSSPDQDAAKLKLRRQIRQPWTVEELPMMGDWLKANSPALDLIAKAARQPSFCVPKISEPNYPVYDLATSFEKNRFIYFCIGFQTRAKHRIAIGNLDEAIDDILTCKILGRRMGHDELPTDAKAGINLEWFSTGIGIAGSLEHQPTEAQLQRLLDTIIDDTGKTIPNKVEGERRKLFKLYAILDNIQNTYHDPSLKEDITVYALNDIFPQWISRHIKLNWNAIAEKVIDKCYHPDILPAGKRKFDPQNPPITALLFPSSRSEVLVERDSEYFCKELHDIDKRLKGLKCAEQLQAITLAMLLYEKQHGHLPPAWTVDKDGKPLHGWRVLLLPYLGEDAKRLYEKIRLDEPWDSMHNRQFHNTAVSSYESPNIDSPPGQTTFTVVIGQKTAFRGSKEVRLDEFGPNSTNLLLVAVRKNPVCWMKPSSEVLESNANTKIASEGLSFSNGGFRSGSVATIYEPVIKGHATHDLSYEKIEANAFQKMLEGTAERIP